MVLSISDDRSEDAALSARTSEHNHQNVILKILARAV